MCAIAGIWSQGPVNSSELTAQARRMADALRHRGPDDGGVWTDAARGLALSQRRLAIIDLSPAGHQPMVSRCGRYVIVFNGECYNFHELRAELVARSVTFRGGSDTEVVLEGFAQLGIEPTLKRMAGMFAIALWDCAEAKLTLIRDRVGKKPLYYGTADGQFVFASELKAIHAIARSSLALDHDALKSFLQFGYIPSPRSVFRDIRKLSPGHTLTLSSPANIPSSSSYWSVSTAYENATRVEISDEEALRQLEEKLRRCVGERMISDVPLGAFLSGGVDSSLVVALMQAQSARPVRTFSIAFEEPEFNEGPHARLVSEHLGTQHTELMVSAREAQEIIPRLPEIYDEPFADASAIPTCLLSSLTREHVTVSLSGDGGDELFLGYGHYEQAAARIDRMLGWPRSLRRFTAGALRALPEPIVDGLCRTTASVLGRRSTGGARLRSHYVLKYAHALAQDSALGMYQAITADWFNPDLALASNGHATPTSTVNWPRAQTMELFGLHDLAVYIADDILVKMDRASMAASLEARAPLLDHRVVEFAFGLPYRCKQRDGVGKWLLRELLYRHVPRALVDRPKQGFAVPVGAWLKGPLRDWAENLLSVESLNCHGVLNPKAIRARWAEHTSGTHDWERLLWNVIMLQAWLQRWRKP
jgi:asparagine synthase (glutamine-hydrolysing)